MGPSSSLFMCNQKIGGLRLLFSMSCNIKTYGWHHRLKACDAQSLAKVITPLSLRILFNGLTNQLHVLSLPKFEITRVDPVFFCLSDDLIFKFCIGYHSS